MAIRQGAGAACSVKTDSAYVSSQPRARSLLHYSPALVLVLIMVADAMRYADSDLWGHIRFGQAVLSQGHLTPRDPYSYSAPGHLWSNHEWLSEVLMAAIYNALGVFGLKLMKLAACAATILLFVLAEAETGAPGPVQLWIATVAAVALAPQMQFRPQLFTFAMLAALMLILTRDNYGRRAPLWMAIPILALWANLHGGFIIGIAALGVYSGVVLLSDLAEGMGLRRGARLLLITAAATLATLATPYGLHTWHAVAHAIRNPVTRMAVSDWQPLIVAMVEAGRTNPAGLIYYGCVLVLVAALAYSVARAPRAGDLPLLAIAVLMAVAAFVSTRNMALFVIAAAGPLARHVAAASALRRAGDGASGASGASRRGNLNPWLVTALAIVLTVYTGLFSSRLEEDKPYPAGAVAFMEDRGLHGNLLCDFNWGEYLIWHTAPLSRVFIDGRYDTVYPAKVIGDYLDFYFEQPGAARVLDAYPHDFVLVPPDTGGYRVTSRSKQWALIYRDPASALFARAGSPAATLAGIPLSGPQPSDLFP